jgi:hypothetical protein
VSNRPAFCEEAKEPRACERREGAGRRHSPAGLMQRGSGGAVTVVSVVKPGVQASQL